MKRFCTTTLVLAGLALSGCRTTESIPRSEQPGTQTVYTVFGMDCPGCHGGLEKNLKKIDGVIDASANWQKKTVTVMMRDGVQVDPAEIEKAVKDSNFSFEGVVK